ncbi:hypothetical protein KXW98_004367 [Aspergillus fumigatus]|nr:hypothetical protein CNMCM8057_003232 [Aspergillus fumigatus]KAF4288073.1 hypothetical protein CNMCM8686_003899 [Aspergillus fumigatus]KAH1321529.1 hypothetical protein KXX47_001392 [Aspergillus fumigatus]KAH1369741.1 hypothetical protein KXX63_006063 [Aspergillus fumigatus]KAH1420227.1 hypothetical protein KXX22_004074 [Aspergillus fumigatus]
MNQTVSVNCQYACSRLSAIFRSALHYPDRDNFAMGATRHIIVCQYKNLFATLSVSPSRPLLSAALQIFQQEVESIKTVRGLVPNFICYPLQRNALAAMKQRGGNALGIDRDEPLFIILISTAWLDRRDDATVNRMTENIISRIEAVAKELKVADRYLYINYASAAQADKVFAGYGEKSRRRLRDIQRSVDPRGNLPRMAKTLPFGDQQVPVPGFGAMGLNSAMGTDLNLEQSEPVLLKAIELGCTFWDTAVAYKDGENEKLLGDFIKKHNVRDRLFVASKCGFDVFGPERKVTNSAAHIKEYIEGTINRLGFTPDLYYLHRIDPNTPLEESIGALDELRRAGKTKYIGLSECSAATLRRAHAIAKIDAVQAEYSAFETLHETTGLIQTAKELGVAFVAFSPLGHGWLVDDFQYKSPDDFAPNDFRRTVPKFQGENFHKNKAIVDEIKKLAIRKGCSVAQIALAWVSAQGLIAIPGTTKPSRLEENWASRDIELTEEELTEMQRIVDAAKPVGERFAPIFQSMVGH